MKCERFKRSDWGLDSTSVLRVRPSGKVFAISFGPDDTSGGVEVRGLPGAHSTARIAPRYPWVGTVDGDWETLEFFPLYQLAGGPNAAYVHTLDIILWYEPVVVGGPRPPAEVRVPVVASTPVSAWLNLIGRERVSVSVVLDGAGVAGAVDIYQQLFVNGSPVSSTVYRRTAIASGTNVRWSPSKRTLAAATIGVDSEWESSHFLQVYCSPGAGLSGDILIRAED